LCAVAAVITASTAPRSASVASRNPRPPWPETAASWAARRAAPASSSASISSGRSRATWLAVHAAGLGFGSFATRAAASLSPALRSSLAAASRAGVNSSSGSP
jgi:hypothetical protein